MSSTSQNDVSNLLFAKGVAFEHQCRTVHFQTPDNLNLEERLVERVLEGLLIAGCGLNVVVVEEDRVRKQHLKERKVSLFLIK
jgi:hypothetical protein